MGRSLLVIIRKKSPASTSVFFCGCKQIARGTVPAVCSLLPWGFPHYMFFFVRNFFLLVLVLERKDLVQGKRECRFQSWHTQIKKKKKNGGGVACAKGWEIRRWMETWRGNAEMWLVKEWAVTTETMQLCNSINNRKLGISEGWGRRRCMYEKGAHSWKGQGQGGSWVPSVVCRTGCEDRLGNLQKIDLDLALRSLVYHCIWA